MQSPSHIVLIGTGWLGAPLLEHWLKLGVHCTVFTSSAERESTLQQQGVEVVNAPLTLWRDHPLPAQAQVLVTWPPMSQTPDGLERHRELCSTLAAWQPKHIWITSSISVYGDPAETVSEYSPALQGASGQVEQIYRELPSLTYLRLGGLFGLKRHPGRFLSGKLNAAKPKAPVNMLHLSDAVAAIDFLVRLEAPLDLYNIVHPDHPSRQHFYSEAIARGGFAPVHFDASDLSQSKVVASDRLLDAGFTFRRASLIDYLDEL